MTPPNPSEAALAVVTGREFVRLANELANCCKAMERMSLEDQVDYGYTDGAEQIQSELASLVESAISQSLAARDKEIEELGRFKEYCTRLLADWEAPGAWGYNLVMRDELRALLKGKAI